jgi:hypothetical protein
MQVKTWVNWTKVPRNVGDFKGVKEVVDVLRGVLLGLQGCGYELGDVEFGKEGGAIEDEANPFIIVVEEFATKEISKYARRLEGKREEKRGEERRREEGRREEGKRDCEEKVATSFAGSR